MRWLLLAIALQSIGVRPAPGEGPYAHKEGWHCYKGNTEEKYKLVQCACKQICDEDGNARDDGACLTYCGSKQCLCHVDEDECHH